MPMLKKLTRGVFYEHMLGKTFYTIMTDLNKISPHIPSHITCLFC
jgi:hypothetical protein